MPVQRHLFVFLATFKYCKTLNVNVPFISQAKQNREIKGREYQLQASIRQNKGAKIILHAKSPTFRAAKLNAYLGGMTCAAG